MFRHILVPTDLTDKSLTALEIAVKMARIETKQEAKSDPKAQGGKITLLHVVEVIEDADHVEFEEFYDKLEKRAGKKMEEMISLYSDVNLNIDKEITFGNRVGSIIRYARDAQIDLIILSSHRIEPNDMIQGWGTISYRVGILSPCPVMLVK